MATRKYEQRLHAEHAEDTRRRILAAVDQLLREAPAGPLTLDRVAAAAKVARTTIYLVFGSRAQLMEAFAEDLWQRSGIAALTAAVATSDARAHLPRRARRAASRMYAAERDIYRALYSMAQLDPASVGAAVEKMDAERRGGMAHLANRLSEDGLLRPELSVEAAADVLWVLCSFESFDLLHTGRRLSVEATIDLLADTAERALYRPEDLVA